MDPRILKSPTKSINAVLSRITHIVAGTAVLFICHQVDAYPEAQVVVGMTYTVCPVAGFDFRTRMIAFPAMTIMCP